MKLVLHYISIKFSKEYILIRLSVTHQKIHVWRRSHPNRVKGKKFNEPLREKIIDVILYFISGRKHLCKHQIL